MTEMDKITKQVLRDDGVTKFYLTQLEELLDYMENRTLIDNTVYKTILSMLPCDLASHLRLVPDASLGPRMSHLLAITSDVLNQLPIANVLKYELISIEGSNNTIPFDCDLVIWDTATKETVFIDYTSSKDESIIEKKKLILSQNLKLQIYDNSSYYVNIFNPIRYKVHITPSYSSSEPGTLGLKLMDLLSTDAQSSRGLLIDKSKIVYNHTNKYMADLENCQPPGDYKEKKFDNKITEAARELIRKQDDVRSIQFLKTCSDLDPIYFPYFNGVKELLTRSKEMKPLVFTESAESLESRDLIANLAALSQDPLAKVLHAACLTDNVVQMDQAMNLSITQEFPVTDKQSIISSASKCIVAAQRKKDHVFTIKFSESFLDPKLKRILMKTIDKKDKRFHKSDAIIEDDDVITHIENMRNQYTSEFNYFSSVNLNTARDTIWRKILTISALSSNDMENFGRSTTVLLDSFLSTISNTYMGSCISHNYEIFKSILASLKTSPSDNTYYVGTNGSYKSVTITKMSSTLDSFTRCAFSVIYKPERIPKKQYTRASGALTNEIFRTDFYSVDANTLSYNLRLPFIITSFATWEIENNLDSNMISHGVIGQILIDSSLVAMINRDQFAQAAEQVRYFYMSSIGYGGSAAEILSKTTFIRARHIFEVIYLLRSYKMAAALSIISSSGELSLITKGFEKELEVCFPHSEFPSKSFSQTISSMYVCNIYNKFRAFHEVSEAMCYNELVEERKIYQNRVNEDPNAVIGLSPSLLEAYKKGNTELAIYINSKDFISNEVEFNTELAILRSNRYSGSAIYMIGAAASHAESSQSVIDAIYDKLSRSPIEACTMRGSMDSKPSSEQNQGIRAASAVLEELVSDFKIDPKSINNSVLGATYFIDKVLEQKKEFSILSCVMNQFNDSSVVYRYRIVQKDQKGHREISVLNFHFRVGALFIETITRQLSSLLSNVDIVNNPSKDKIIEDSFLSTFDKESTRSGTYCYDNSDQKRWGPNHNMNFFAYALFPMLSADPGLFRLALRVFDLTFDKRAKYPESLIKLIVKKNMSNSMSLPINNFLQYAVPKVNAKIFEERFAMGMCQGIFQQTSSTIHSIKVTAHADVVNMVYPNVSIKSLTTSDDAEQIIYLPYGSDRVETIKLIHCLTLRVGNLFNIVRSNPKSAYNFHIGELNSIFMKKGRLATPSLKQRIAKIDVGNGVNHIEDYLSVMASAANYLSSGGSYMGSIIVSILNLTLHTEQWLRWEFAKSAHYYKAVEFGGFPVIEPVTTLISGGMSNFYQRVSGVLSPESYSRVVVNSLLCPPEEVTLEEFARRGSERVMRSYKGKDISVFRGTGPLGLFQLVKTDRKLSQFERRHGISRWHIPESFATLKRDSPMASDFLFSLFRNTSVSTLDTNIGVNGFFIRMAEPWASYNRPCLRMSKASPFCKTFFPDGRVVSHNELFDVMKRLTVVDSGWEMDMAFRRSSYHPEFEIMEAQLAVRLNDAKSIMDYMRSQVAESFKIVHSKPSIQTITLRGHTAADSDSYLISIIKTLSGKKSRGLINEYRHSSIAYDSIIATEPSAPMELLPSIIMADNAVSLYEKFIRRNTKMIIPNRVDQLKDLVVDILNNKFTEHLGVVLEGTLNLSEERTRTYAYSHWYQDLIRKSEDFEAKVADSILRSESKPEPYVGISSNQIILTKSDNFELVDSTTADKTIMLDVRSKDQLVSTMRTWLAAKSKFILSRETIKGLIAGKLTFAHDYYVGNDTYYRYAKSKYMDVFMGSSKGLHVIKTSLLKGPTRTVTTYRHMFIFDENVSNRKVRVELTEIGKSEDWCHNLKDRFENIIDLTTDRWYNLSIASDMTYRRHRKTMNEADHLIVHVIKPGMEFRSTTQEGSLCLSLSSKSFTMPISYLQPNKVSNIAIGYKLTNTDLVKATKLYSKLRFLTNNFSRTQLQSNASLRACLDFILVHSTTDTPERVIDKALKEELGTGVNAIQLDILRTFLIRNTKIGVGFSSHRFNQYLLNLGNRRRHDHSYLIKTVMGQRVDQDSEDIDGESIREEILVTGNVDPNEFDDINSDDGYEQPEHVLNVGKQGDQSCIDNTDILSNKTWSEEALRPLNSHGSNDVDELNELQGSDREDWATTAHEITFDQESNTGSDEEEVVIDNAAIEGVQLTNEDSPIERKSDSPSLNELFGEFMKGSNFDDIFDPQEDAVLPSDANDGLVLESLDDIFNKALNGAYDKIKDVKDSGLKSVKSGHTVNPILENARSIIRFLKDWVNKVGDSMELDQKGILSANVSSITDMYLLMEELNVLDVTNVLEKFYKMDGMHLPVDLSALAIINELH